MEQSYHPLSKEQYQSIKVGDVIERMLAFAIPMYLMVTSVEGDIIHTGEDAWTFDRNTGLEIDDAIPSLVSYISKILTEDEKEFVKKEGKLVKL